MGSGCCKAKTIDASLDVVQTQTVAAREIPYDYVLIYSGVLTKIDTYTCPRLSIHSYHQSSEKTAVRYADTQFSNKKKFYGKLGPLAASQEEHLSSDETAFVIPVEDVIHIYYTTDVKKSAKAEPHLRLVPVVEKKRMLWSLLSEFGGINSTNAISYPSPQELLQILNQPYYGIFGDLYQERLHSIQAQQAFRTHVPAPTTTRITAEIAMRPADKFQEGRKINYNIIQYY
ncbi:unnamed protein product [Rotaria magnacalcarata]|uniref:Uncharacterized protein n=1 Tax=Rotaria magnacalcarata TaxID=392030 RepID=A0A8S2QX05_9BILA|nr:unnamed protein product [Rotaria magnacalcarata]